MKRLVFLIFSAFSVCAFTMASDSPIVSDANNLFQQELVDAEKGDAESQYKLMEMILPLLQMVNG